MNSPRITIDTSPKCKACGHDAHAEKCSVGAEREIDGKRVICGCNEQARVFCTCGAGGQAAYVPDPRTAWRHNGACPHAKAGNQDQDYLRAAKAKEVAERFSHVNIAGAAQALEQLAAMLEDESTMQGDASQEQRAAYQTVALVVKLGASKLREVEKR